MVIGGGSSGATATKFSINDEDSVSGCDDLASQAAAVFGLLLRGYLIADC